MKAHPLFTFLLVFTAPTSYWENYQTSPIQSDGTGEDLQEEWDTLPKPRCAKPVETEPRRLEAPAATRAASKS